MNSVDPAELQVIDEYHDVSREQFELEIQPKHRPAVLRGLARDWPIVAAAASSTNDFASYVRDFDPDRKVRAFVAAPEINGRFFYSDDFRGFNFRHQEFSLSGLLDELQALADKPDAPSVYAGAVQLTGSLEAIRKANHHELLDDEVEQLVSIWLGNQGRTAAHWDLPQNIACVICGERRFTVFPPEQLANMYIGPLDVTLAGQPVSLVDLEDPDFERFPDFAKALESASTALLEPGDAIYIPSMWFHHVQNYSPLGALLNFWWRESAMHMFTPLFTLFHAILSIRDLPSDEREHWKRMFDHYIFSDDGDPMPYVPEEARGVFREMTPERAAALRAFLLHSLGGEPRRK